MNDDNVITENTVPQKKGGKKKQKTFRKMTALFKLIQTAS